MSNWRALKEGAIDNHLNDHAQICCTVLQQSPGEGDRQLISDIITKQSSLGSQ